jgi:hypothetical protein
LAQGENLYSLGNPLDLGFTIVEGTFNGISQRGFSDRLMFTGAINSGMSGGPSITAKGILAGVNVSVRRDGQLVSFLVPARFVVALLASAGEHPQAQDVKPLIGTQLLSYQREMIDTVLRTPLALKRLGPYAVPLRESEQLRCWGGNRSKSSKPYELTAISCRTNNAVFVQQGLVTGSIIINHQFTHNKSLNSLQFAALTSKLFGNKVSSTSKSDVLTSAHCHEDFIKPKQLSLRAVICVEAYHQFPDLYDFTLNSSSLEQDQNLQTDVEIKGVSYANGLRLLSAILEGIDLQPSLAATAIPSAEEVQP